MADRTARRAMTTSARTGSPSASIPTVRVGKTDLEISRLGIGTVPIGNMMGPVDESDATETVRRGHALGARLIDTAPQYGSGLAERRVGSALAGIPRDEVAVSTKVGRLLRRTSTTTKVMRVLREAATSRHGVQLVARNAIGVVRRATGRDHTFPLGYPFERGEAALEPYFDFSYDGVMRSVEGSLERLGLDRIDMLFIHDPDDHHREALDGAYRALDELRSSGEVKAIGVGMNHPGPMAQFAREASFDCFLLAGKYTLLDQSGLDELLPECVERGITVNVGGVFNSGLLADPRPGVTFDYHPVVEGSPILERARRMAEVCGRHGVPLAAAALQFPLAHPAVGAVLAGVRSPAEVDEDVRLFTWPIPAQLWEELRESGLVARHVPLPNLPAER